MSLKIHTPIIEKLQYFHKINKIPHIIFHGPSGSGKRTVVNDFINIIYKNDKERIKSYVMYVNCAHGKGIKFIREELKFFAKSHIHCQGGDLFKSIVLLNADKLTIDAQSALRRCIELFSHNTRFFIIVEDKYKLLKPILSRFCEINVPEPQYKGNTVHLYKYNLNETFHLTKIKSQRMDWLKKELLKNFQSKLETVDENINIDEKEDDDTQAQPQHNYLEDAININIQGECQGQGEENKEGTYLAHLSVKLYERGYSGLDIIQLLENTHFCSHLKDEKRYELLFAFNRVKKEFRNEKLIILFILNFLFLSSNYSLENISFM